MRKEEVYDELIRYKRRNRCLNRPIITCRHDTFDSENFIGNSSKLKIISDAFRKKIVAKQAGTFGNKMPPFEKRSKSERQILHIKNDFILTLNLTENQKNIISIR